MIVALPGLFSYPFFCNNTIYQIIPKKKKKVEPENHLRELNTLNIFCVMFTRETAFMTAGLDWLHIDLLLTKKYCFKRKECAPMRGKHLPARVIAFFRREVKLFKQLSPLNIGVEVMFWAVLCRN